LKLVKYSWSYGPNEVCDNNYLYKYLLVYVSIFHDHMTLTNNYIYLT